MFDKNIKEFPTMLHRDIYMTALRMTPPEVSLGEIEKIDPELVKNGWEFYAFMIELLADMYRRSISWNEMKSFFKQYNLIKFIIYLVFSFVK